MLYAQVPTDAPLKGDRRHAEWSPWQCPGWVGPKSGRCELGLAAAAELEAAAKGVGVFIGGRGDPRNAWGELLGSGQTSQMLKGTLLLGS